VELFRGIEGVIAAHHPDAVAMEESFLAKNARTALVLGHARGALVAAACAAGAPFYEYAPSSVKKMVGGSGRASKEGLARILVLQLGLSSAPESLDASDALAVAWTHLQHLRSPLSIPKGRHKKGAFDVGAYLEEWRRQNRSPVTPGS
jgi:crossover junction endodeoxyribonuclease RuvC